MGNIEAAKTNLQKAQELFTAQGNTAGAEQIANIFLGFKQFSSLFRNKSNALTEIINQQISSDDAIGWFEHCGLFI
jgi:hypothetical protein